MRGTHNGVLLAGALLLSAIGCTAAVTTPVKKAPAAVFVPGGNQSDKASAITWKQALIQPDDWYGGPEAIRIADNVLLYQHDNGGWDKNIDMTPVLSDKQKAKVAQEKKGADTTIDNGSTYKQMAYLARVYTAAREERFKEGFLKGMDYLLAAQYENGGWPQYYPLRKGYYTHITFNDGAMIGVMNLLQDVVRNDPRYYAFVDEARRARAEKAVKKGIDCVLKCQVVVDGKPTVWCAQHDERTFAPAAARAYELVSLSGSESVAIVRFLMSIEAPGPDVIRAIEGAINWFEAAKLPGIKLAQKEDKNAPKGVDIVVVPDPSAPPMWARFYTIGANKPFFSDRDGIVRYSLSEIGYERRNGYSWLGTWPASLLEKDYPKWKAKRAAKASAH